MYLLSVSYRFSMTRVINFHFNKINIVVFIILVIILIYMYIFRNLQFIALTYICRATPSKEIGTNEIRIRDESVARHPFTKKVYTR